MADDIPRWLAPHARGSVYRPDELYFRLTVSFNGRSCDDPPARNMYSPGSSCHPFFSSLKIDRYLGSTAMMTCLLSPGLSLTLLQPTSRFGGSAAAAGREA